MTQPQNGSKTAERLISGLSRISRERAEIKNVALLIANIGREEFEFADRGYDRGRQILFGRGAWTIILEPKKKWAITCHGCNVINSWGAYIEPSHRFVTRVRAELDDFVAGVMSEFPNIAAALSPYFDAADLD